MAIVMKRMVCCLSRKPRQRYATPNLFMLCKANSMKKRRIAEAVAEYEAKKRRVLEDVQRSGGVYGKEELAHYLEDDEEEEVDSESLGRMTTVQTATLATPEDLQTLVLEKKKQLMMEKYA